MTAKDKASVEVTPLPLPEASGDTQLSSTPLMSTEGKTVDVMEAYPGGTPPAPKKEKKTPMQKAIEKCDEIDAMVAHAHVEVRDTVRSITAQIRDLLS